MMPEIDKGKMSTESDSAPPCRERLITYRTQLQHDRNRCRRLEIRWSWIRLATFITGVIVVVLLRHDLLFAALAAFGGLAAFAGAVLRHTHWEDRRTTTERVLIVIDESLHASTRRDAPARDWQRPKGPGDASMSPPEVIESGPTWSLTDQEQDDLDLYGRPVGIFGLLNRTSTDLGARRLRDMLDAPCLCPEHIQQRQQAVRWLSEHQEQRLGMMASIVPLRGRSEHLDRLVQLLRGLRDAPPSLLSKGVRLWSVFSGLLLLYALLRVADGRYEWAQVILTLLLINNVALIAFKSLFRRLDAQVSPWTNLRSSLSRFLAVAERAEADLPGETQLSLLKDHFRHVVADAHIPSLCAWLEWAGLHGLVRGLLNMTVFLDLHVAEAVLARVAPNRDILLNGLSAMAELEALGSLASFSDEQPVACYPQSAAGAALSIEDGRHPLLLEPDATPNSIRLTSTERTWVVTGPNAAGKSTFLRMVGINTLLAQIGAAVTARDMEWSPVRLITDVRIRDDLARHESYFLSEVRRLRRLVLDSGDDAPALGLIDEPFRGTNSQERIAAGVALLEHLMGSDSLFLVATHEDALAQTATNTASAANYHFQEHLTHGGIAFDYRLRAGPASTRTALRILEQEGYPEPLLERARRLISNGIESNRLD